MNPSPARSLAAALALSALCLTASPLAQPVPAPPAQPAPAAVEVRVGETVTIDLPRPPMILGAEDESIARVVVLADGRAAVTGVAVGHTRVIGRDFAQVPLIYPVVVRAASGRH